MSGKEEKIVANDRGQKSRCDTPGFDEGMGISGVINWLSAGRKESWNDILQGTNLPNFSQTSRFLWDTSNGELGALLANNDLAGA